MYPRPAVSNVLDGPDALLQVGSAVSGKLDAYGSISGPASFGFGTFEYSTSQSGDFGGIAGDFYGVEVDSGYVSGASISGSATWDNNTISGLGLTPGTYTFTWGSGATADSLVVNIAGTAAPEPASLTLLGMGVAGLGLRAWRRRRRAVA